MIRELTEEQRQRRKASRQAEEIVINLLSDYYSFSGLSVARCESKFSRVDGIVLDEETLHVRELIEIKCRNYSRFDMFSKYKGEVAVDCHKLNSMQQLSDMLQIPSVLYVYTMKDGAVYRIPITNRKGGWMVPDIKAVPMVVPRNVGGDRVERRVAMITVKEEQLLTASAGKFEV